MNTPPHTSHRGISLLKGDPKQAIIHLSIPVIIAMLLQSVYNLVDAIWVAGLGEDALAAVGFVTPLFLILIGLGNGLGAGVTSAIARRIGSGDRMGAGRAAMQGIGLILIISALITPCLVLYAEPIAALLGAGDATALTAEYARIVFLGTPFLLFASISYAIFNAEGSTRKTMYAMGASAVINCILDPILIYPMGLGVAGAAWATVISILLVTAVITYWLCIEQKTYVTLRRKDIRPEREISADIIRVGIPGSLQFVMMSVVAILINALLVTTSGNDGVAVYTAGWRVVLFSIIPLIGISVALISLAGASYGARDFERLRQVHRIALGYGIVISLALTAATWLLAPYLAVIFTYSAESAHLAPGITAFLRTICWFFPFVPAGIFSSAIFQGTGRGISALILEFFRNIVFIAVFIQVLGISLSFGESGIWWGIVAGNTCGGLLGFAWMRRYTRGLVR
ncbi:MAG: MATE family efflux transporter [Methanocalculus sp. MSAO_Arc1]|uniref:MATE family efflux transporter n=1 Tax=Methanocalculus TaxID=71151 RepID=UPI000FEE2169|nr:MULTISPECIES: MATE family efflux transporter [unclassified Methanocalculus]MCP1661660.1 putative MATE family efflux protein [Methanocalculus sp. AMF5]RQD81922.1 MAG: MATE family efflux transporter [Methanocalculus sp. MSAO_Arc1]